MDEVTIVEPQGSLKNLPCARAVWKPKPDLKTAVQCWITAGGSHHTCMTTSVGREAWEDFARIAGVELAVIDENTNARQFEKELELSEMYHRRGALKKQHGGEVDVLLYAAFPAVLFLFTYVRLSACRRTAAGRSRRRTRGSLPDAPPSATASGTCSPA